ncbi:helix-turn-helix domain-containing protein [Leucobacter aridicollis]|uniref:helix-turn-helix domain-containing protein n=1 Tax=Leucobacter aridicollis TaxID=283878 RepID=UPI001D5EC169|nr:PucR family transcriptional regulator [Leucobacter aridicollis]MBL3680833.1 PucR family transcriptional regulator [Leucobacter aridicollis]
MGWGSRGSYAVELKDLTESRLASDISVRFQPDAPTRVQELALISDIEEITAVGPDTVVLLSNAVSTGGWMVSAALRYAWERRACAVLAPDHAVTDATVELARRLNVALLTSRRDITQLGLDIAIQLGIARAGVVARIQAFSEHISQAASLSELASLISREFGGSKVQVRVSGAVTVDREEVPQPSDGTRADDGEIETLSVDVSHGTADIELVLIGTGGHTRDYAEQTLRAAAPVLRALLHESRLTAILDSLPVMSIASLIGSAAAGQLDEPALALVLREDHIVADRYRCVCILVADRESAGAAVHQVWQQALPDVPLIAIADGWLAFVPAGERGARPDSVAEIRRGFGAVRLLGASIGASAERAGHGELLDGVREAWLAARIAGPSGVNGVAEAIGAEVLEFSEIPARLLDRLVPTELAGRLAGRLFPDLIADPAAHEIVEAVVTYLGARGSVSGAAELLGVHRNTIQTRIRRAEDLGVPLGDPAAVLSTHMLLASLLRSLPR